MTHFDESGHPRMVDVTEKAVTTRTATAAASVVARPETLRMIRSGQSRKGDVLAVARLAAIQATKHTALLIPLCHPIPVEAVDVEFDFPDERTVQCQATVKTTSRTGVEMEALTAVSTAALTIYDMCKSTDRGIRINEIHLISKEGGASGSFKADFGPRGRGG